MVPEGRTPSAVLVFIGRHVRDGASVHMDRKKKVAGRSREDTSSF